MVARNLRSKIITTVVDLCVFVVVVVVVVVGNISFFVVVDGDFFFIAAGSDFDFERGFLFLDTIKTRTLLALAHKKQGHSSTFFVRNSYD